MIHNLSEKLKIAGFVPFLHLSQIERDGLERLTKISSLDEEAIIFMLVKKDNTWMIDYIKANNINQKYVKEIQKINSISAVIRFIDKYGL